jgi:hypothetical protein
LTTASLDPAYSWAASFMRKSEFRVMYFWDRYQLAACSPHLPRVAFAEIANRL